MNSSNHGLCVCMLVHCPAQDRIINFTLSLLWENKMWAVKEEEKKSLLQITVSLYPQYKGPKTESAKWASIN